MPLRDHFRSPVNDTHSWDEVHGQWPGELVRHLLTILPAGFRSAPKVHLGSPFEPEFITVDSRDTDARTETLTALSPTLTVEAELLEQDEYEVRIYDVERGRQLVAAIEIVSPSNKDRPESRELFLGKVASLLQQGVCVSLIDLVTVRKTNLFVDLLKMFGRSDPAPATASSSLYSVTLCARKPKVRRQLLDAWFYPMTLGQPLPTLPIWLTPDLRVMLPLETSYEETCRVLGIA